MAKGNSSSGLLGRLTAGREVKTFDNQRNAEQAGHMVLGGYGTPVIFNTDQGCQFTSERFTDVPKAHGIQISMDGKGRWIDTCIDRAPLAQPEI